MNLKEKFAQEYVDPLSSDLKEVPYSPHFLNLLESAYIAGFDQALNRAAVRGRIAQLEGRIVDVEIKKVGEEEIP